MKQTATANTLPANVLPASVLPDRCVHWLATSRVRFLTDMKEGKPMRYFAAHLPVMSTWQPPEEGGSLFPVNMTVKGIGLIPRDDLLADYTDKFESVLARVRTKPWQETLGDRVDAFLELYAETGNFMADALGGLEIFEGKALKNLREHPYASLLYVGMSHTEEGIQYVSFQVNGTVEILEKDNPHYRFLLAARKLFEFDTFHLYQSDYPFGYLIRVQEVKDKSPWSRPHSHSPHGQAGGPSCPHHRHR